MSDQMSSSHPEPGHPELLDEGDRFDDDVFRAIATSEGEAAGHSDGHADGHSDAMQGGDEGASIAEAKPSRKGSVREAAAAIDSRLHAVGEWLGHLEGIEPTELWEDEADRHGHLVGLRAIGDSLAGWKLEVSVSTSRDDADWGGIEGRSVMERMRALKLTQAMLKEIVEQQRRLIAEIRGAVKEFDSAAASLGVRVSR